VTQLLLKHIQETTH